MPAWRNPPPPPPGPNRVKAKLSDIGIIENIYINENLCPYYKTLRYKCKKLWQAKMIYSFWIYGGKVFIQLNENDVEKYPITHVNDLCEKFTEVDLEEIYKKEYPK